MFQDNGHNRNKLEKIAKEYTPPTIKRKDGHSKKQNNRQNKNNHTKEIPENLFDVLPFKDTTIGDETAYKPYACLPFIPGPTGHRLRRAFAKAGANLYTKSGTKLKDVLCSANTSKHDPLLKPGVYEFQCSCSEKAKYVGQTTRSMVTRGKEHGRATEKCNWQHSGITAHKEHCKEPIDWTKPTVITTMSDKNKRRLNYNLKVREALEIKRRNCGPGEGLNEDYGAYVKTSMWNPVFHRMNRD